MRKVYLRFIFLCVLFFGLTYSVKAEVDYDYFDSIFENNTFSLYTDIDIDNDYTFNNFVVSVSEFGYYDYTEGNYNNYYHTYLNVDSCDFSEMSCDFMLFKSSTIDGEYNSEYIKNYNNISIIIVSDINQYFDMVDNNDIVSINYPESLFDYEEEKDSYISNFVNSFSNNSSYYYKQSQYIYHDDYSSDSVLSIIRCDRIASSGRVTRRMIKKIDNFVFDYHEEPFSDTYKKFSSGTFEINSDIEIDKSKINDFFTFNSSSIFKNSYLKLTILGNVKDNKAMVELQERDPNTYVLLSSEKHLITFVIKEVDNYFDFLENDNFIINYPEEMFKDNSEKFNYIQTYLYDYNSSVTPYTNYIFRYENISTDNYKYYLMCTVNNNGNIGIYYKNINNIIFSYHEDEYSDDFKKLSNGEFIINTDFEISNQELHELVSNSYSVWNNDYSVSFSITGSIKDNQAVVKMRKHFYSNNSTIYESHLIHFSYDNNIDLNIFDKINLKNDYKVYSDMPSSNVLQFLNSYLGLSCYAQINNKEYYYVRLIDENFVYVKYFINDNDTSTVIYHKVPIIFVGYSESMSDKYQEFIGTELIVHSDVLDGNSIIKTLEYVVANYFDYYDFNYLNCTDDYSYCDITMKSNTDALKENHRIKITLDSNLSSEFKEQFNINSNNKISIYLTDMNAIDNNLEINLYSSDYSDITFYNYTRKYYYCNLEKCDLHLEQNGYYESHTINVNYITSSKSYYYKSSIKDSVDIYFGETEPGDITAQPSKTMEHYFNKSEGIDSFIVKCNSNYDRCSVGLSNDENNIEIHYVDINKKSGVSSEYQKLLDNGVLKLRSINKHNFDFDYVVSYIQNSSADLYDYYIDYRDGDIYLHYFLEMHKINIEYYDANEEYKDIIDSTINQIGDYLKYELDDLDYLNSFYYSMDAANSNEYASSNYDSSTVYDILSKQVADKNINYFLVHRLGDGDPYYTLRGGDLVLFYKGIAYDKIRCDILYKNIIYIPDDTPDSNEAYIAAAQKRIDEYLGENSGVTISYDHDAKSGETNGIAGNYTGPVFKIRYKNRGNVVLLIKDSSKMQSKKFKAVDVYNNVVISSNESNLPNDTVVNTEYIDNKSDLYNEILDKVGLDNAIIIDINLYSRTYGEITDVGNVEYEVFIPLDLSKFASRDLYAYYISGDNIEAHKITIGEFYSSFKTNHFSTYIIGEKLIEKISLLQSFINKGYKVKNNFVHGFKINDLISSVKSFVGLDFVSTSSSSIITTGMQLKYNDDLITTVIYGDLNGDGVINSADLLKMRQHLLGTSTLSGAYKEAASIATGTTINSADLLRIRQHLLGTKLIEQ